MNIDPIQNVMPSFTNNHGFQIFDDGEPWEHRTDFEKLDRLLKGFDEDGDRLEVESLVVDGDTPVLGSEVLHATRYAGANGGERIQNALEDAATRSNGAVVVVPGTGPDDLTDYETAERNSGWLLEGTVRIPSQTTLLLEGAYLVLADGVYETMLMNEHAADGTGDRDEHVHVVGRAGAQLDGNPTGQYPFTHEEADEPDALENYGIVFHKVDHASVRNLIIGPTSGWGGLIQDFTYAFVHNLDFVQDATTIHQDGFSFGGPGRFGVMDGLRGTVGDDCMTVYAGQKNLPYTLVDGEGGDVRDIVLSNAAFETPFDSRPGRASASIRLYTAGNAISGVNISNISMRAGNVRLQESSYEDAGFGDLRNINITNVVAEKPDAFLHVWGWVENVTVTNVTIHDADGDFLYFADDRGGVSPNLRNLTVQNVDIRSGHKLLYAGPEGGRLENITFQNINYRSPGDEILGAKIHIATDDVARDVTFDRIRMEGDGQYDAIWIDGDVDLCRLLFQNVHLTDFEEGINVAGAAGDTVPPVQFRNVTFDRVGRQWWIDRTCVTRNGIGVAAGESERPDADDWVTGQIVQYTDTDDGSGDGLYMLLPDGNWCNLDTDAKD